MPWFVVSVCSCYYGRWTHFGGVSLNRSEQQIFEYIEANREERHFWEYKVRGYASKLPELAAAAHVIEGDLWRYYVERAGVVPALKQIVEREGLRRVSMRNLADYLLRLWGPPRTVKRPQPDLHE